MTTMTKAEFAGLCNVAPSRVSHWIKEGKILASLPYLAAGALEGAEVPARVRFAAYLWCKRDITAELGKWCPVPEFDEPDWAEITAETGEAVDFEGWQAWAEETMWKAG